MHCASQAETISSLDASMAQCVGYTLYFSRSRQVFADRLRVGQGGLFSSLILQVTIKDHCIPSNQSKAIHRHQLDVCMYCGLNWFSLILLAAVPAANNRAIDRFFWCRKQPSDEPDDANFFLPLAHRHRSSIISGTRWWICSLSMDRSISVRLEARLETLDRSTMR
jgi:hypothetical protein